jgi:hypothetical protein
MIARTERQTPGVRSALTVRHLAAFAAAGTVVFWLVALGIVTPLERDFLHSLGWRETGPSSLPDLSLLALGPIGWLQILNFGQLGLSLIALTAGLWKSLVPRPRVGATFILLGGVAWLASMFKADPSPGTPVSWHGWLNALAFGLVIVAFVLGALTLAVEMRKDERWRWVGFSGPSLLALTILVGAANRLLPPLPFAGVHPLLVVFAWYELLALRLLFLTRSETARPDRDQEAVSRGTARWQLWRD